MATNTNMSLASVYHRIVDAPQAKGYEMIALDEDVKHRRAEESLYPSLSGNAPSINDTFGRIISFSEYAPSQPSTRPTTPPRTPIVVEAKIVRFQKSAPQESKRVQPPVEKSGFEKAIYERPLAKGQPDIYDGSVPSQPDIYDNPDSHSREDIYTPSIRPKEYDIYKSPYEKYRPTDIYKNPYESGGRNIYKSTTPASVIYDKEHKLIVDSNTSSKMKPLPPQI
mmetsp:Transcript_31322/g.76411  ORF Transcript_31322/g.76411 Transcript_31322/m.76411 type:complete len:224 (+) Transcript_31322:154-825(+)